MNKIFLGIFFALILFSVSSWSDTSVYLELTEYGERMNLGLSRFVPVVPSVKEAAMSRQVHEVVRSDILFVRVINLIEGGSPPVRGKINLKNWETMGAQLVVWAQTRIRRRGNIELRGIMQDPLSQKTIFQNVYRGTTKDWRILAHQFSNDIVKALGLRGIFLSKLTFVNDQTGRKEVYTADYDGDNTVRLTLDKSIALFPRFSPDGQKIIFTSYLRGNPDLHIMNADGSGRKVLSKYRGLNTAARWHPNGKSICLTLSYQGEPNLYLINLMGKVKNRLTFAKAGDTAPSFSPSGHKITFTSDRMGYPQIYTMDVSGTSLERMTINGEADSPVWSPDGNLIAFVLSEGESYDIFTIEPSTLIQKRLTWGEGRNENPAWSPDGQYIAFISNRRGRNEIFIMGRDGTNPTPWGMISGNSFTPHWGAQ